MDPWIIATVVISVALFVLPFKQPKLEYAASNYPRSLWQVLRKEARWTAGGKQSFILLRLGFAISLLVVFLPPVMLAQFQLLAQQGGVLLRLSIFVQAIALLLGCALSVLAILISDMIVGFGTPVRRSTTTPIAWLIPIYEVTFALGAIVAAFVV